MVGRRSELEGRFEEDAPFGRRDEGYGEGSMEMYARVEVEEQVEEKNEQFLTDP